MMIDEDDHRRIGAELDLFHFQDEAPGMVFWHPRGLVLYRLLEDAVRAHCRSQSYAEVRTPQLMRRPVWEASGHWAHFHEGMFRVQDQATEAAMKPVSCPGHIYIAKHRLPSYRDLPMRLCELGVVHRDEPSGTLHGLLRVRQFTQDDGHVFCEEHDAIPAILAFCESVVPFYRAFGFANVRLALSTRPAERVGDDATWDRAEAALREVLARLGVSFDEQPGAGAFYGPKLEFALEDGRGRAWQCGTIQFDFFMPERFDLRYVAATGERRRPVMLHRAVYGSLERFLGILLEHYGARLPAWLAPAQVVVLPVTEAEVAPARALEAKLARRGLRAHVDADDTLARRIAAAHAQAIPYQLVLGRREASSGTVTLRSRDGQHAGGEHAILDELAALCRAPDFA